MKILFLIAVLVLVSASKFTSRDGRGAKHSLNIWNPSAGKLRMKHGKHGKTLGVLQTHPETLQEENVLHGETESEASMKLKRLLKCIHSGMENSVTSVLADTSDCPCPLRSTHRKILSNSPYEREHQTSETSAEEMPQTTDENPCEEFESDGRENLGKLRSIIDEILVTLDTVERQKATVENLRDKLSMGEN